jgi:hypothetical protein
MIYFLKLKAGQAQGVFRHHLPELHTCLRWNLTSDQ